MSIQATKELIKNRFQEKYLEFMQDFNNINFTLKMLKDKYGVNQATLARWTDNLNYHRTFRIKRLIQSTIRISKRVKARKDASSKLINFIMNLNK